MYKLTAAILATTLTMVSQPALSSARLVVAHFAPFADTIDGTAVHVAANGNIILEDVKYKDFTPYMELDAGDYIIDIIPVGSMEPAITEEFTLEDGNDYTVIAVGNGVTQDLDLWPLLDNTDMPAMDELNIRIGHAAPFAASLEQTEVSIRTDGGDIVNMLTEVPFGAASGFFPIPAGPYDLKIASNDGSVNLIDIAALDLPADVNLSVFAIGDGINQPLGVLAIPGGELETVTPVDNSANGLYTVIGASGFGFNLIPMPKYNRLVGNWYQPDQNGDPTYFYFDSCQEPEDEMDDSACSTPGGFDGVTATTSLYQCLGGSLDMSDLVECTAVGTIDFDVLNCTDVDAWVTIGMDAPVLFEGLQMSRSIPCTDPEPEVQ